MMFVINPDVARTRSLEYIIGLFSLFLGHPRVHFLKTMGSIGRIEFGLIWVLRVTFDFLYSFFFLEKHTVFFFLTYNPSPLPPYSMKSPKTMTSPLLREVIKHGDASSPTS